MINVDIDVISLLISIEKKIYIYYPSNEIKEREERKKKIRVPIEPKIKISRSALNNIKSAFIFTFPNFNLFVLF